MRIVLLMVAGLALAGFLVVAVVLPQMAGAETKQAADALLAGAEAAQKQVTERAEKSGNVAGSGAEVKITAKKDPKHGGLKWLGAEKGALRGWNEKKAIQNKPIPSMPGRQIALARQGY